MSVKQNQDKLDKRALALRENLKKRKALAKNKASDKPQKKDDKDGNGQG